MAHDFHFWKVCHAPKPSSSIYTCSEELVLLFQRILKGGGETNPRKCMWLLYSLLYKWHLRINWCINIYTISLQVWYASLAPVLCNAPVLSGLSTCFISSVFDSFLKRRWFNTHQQHCEEESMEHVCQTLSRLWEYWNQWVAFFDMKKTRYSHVEN